MKQAQTVDTIRPDRAATDASWPEAIAPALAKVDEELQAGRAKQALEILRRTDTTSPWVANALGVCQLRLGQAQAAVDTLRKLAVADHLNLRSDAPVVFKANFATALLLSGNLAGGVRTLKEIGADRHPAVERLQAALSQWQNSLSFWERFNWWLGGEPSRPVALDSPGDLR